MADAVKNAAVLETDATKASDVLTTRQVDAGPQVRAREVISVLAMVVLADVTIYRGHGFAGVALLLLLSLPLFVLGTSRPRFRAGFWLVAGMLLLLAARLVWLGSALGVGSGVALLMALAVALRGRPPHVLDVVARALQTIFTGPAGLWRYGPWVRRLSPDVARSQWLGVLLPVAALALFGGLFVMANPDLATWVMRFADDAMRGLERWLLQMPFHVREVFFWIAVAWFVAGLLWPGSRSAVETTTGDPLTVSSARSVAVAPTAETTWYAPVRNTLVSVIVLFAVYLAFEFRTLWFREFLKGFHYSGYAHEGAAWLTTALAFATLMLSMMFHGELLRDARVRRLRTLAWIWSAENFLLAITVYNRLHIYINYNGMTRMRMVALFGISAVVLGFLLVVRKISRNHGFGWLVRSELWALAIVVYLFALTPVDAIVHGYNVRQILSGDLAPVVPIAVHKVDSEGIMMLGPLVECRDTTIREGVKALLAERAMTLDSLTKERAELGWTTYQIADQDCFDRLQASRDKWGEFFFDKSKRDKALAKFREYAYQWY